MTRAVFFGTRKEGAAHLKRLDNLVKITRGINPYAAREEDIQATDEAVDRIQKEYEERVAKARARKKKRLEQKRNASRGQERTPDSSTSG